MMLQDLIQRTRSFRRFFQDEHLPIDFLRYCVDMARLAGSARNAQPLQYILVNDPKKCAQVFSCLGWAGYLTDWPGPAEGERPAAYICCCRNTDWVEGRDAEVMCDVGIATQNILLAAMEQGIGGCRIGSFSSGLADLLALPEHLRLLLVVALGRPRENVVIERQESMDDVRYWRDADGIHHVPKRSLEEVLVS